ncbi:hypothetical protein YC2023_018031 [Brassica napus]
MNFETGRRGGNGEQMQKTQLLLNGGGVSRHERSRYSGVEADNATAEGLAHHRRLPSRFYLSYYPRNNRDQASSSASSSA